MQGFDKLLCMIASRKQKAKQSDLENICDRLNKSSNSSFTIEFWKLDLNEKIKRLLIEWSQ